MNRLFALLALCLALIMSGCAEAPPPNPAIEMALAEAKTACYNSQASQGGNDAKLVDPKDILLGKAIDALSKAVGKGLDPCAGIVTNNDLQKVAMEENTKQLASLADFGKSAAGNIVVGVGVWKGLDVLPELFKGAGSTYNLTASGEGGAITATDAFKDSTIGNITGENQLGGILGNSTVPTTKTTNTDAFNTSTAEPFFAPVTTK